MAKATRLRSSARWLWKGAAARMVASKARSSVRPLAGRAWMYRPRLRSEWVRDRRPERLRYSLSRAVSSLRGAKVLPILTFSPPSHQ
jgi:hypothetical protein